MVSVLVLLALGLVVLFCFVVFWGPPYVPSKPSDVARAFDELYHVGPNDLIVDIGSGDGSVLRAAAKRGARAVGYELNPLLVLVSRWLSRQYDGVEVQLGNFWHMHVPQQTTAVYVFGESRDIEKMANWVENQATRLGRELYFVSYGFTLQRPALRQIGAHHLYVIKPLQPAERSV